ncbi:hypothetical protein [Leptospira sarikeiensis]|uniref:Uncharacterized protein n=1 Tax=Leptospira sarikeiensis TaxID=2484943 RepID=A0A4V3JS71_9LEPT|nr:hypothetical protein [Leptospira sarikeiensis]TGL63540.1 hypothetical protein EHQ64_06200 [Leptospira sarikeiensis]
MRGTFREKIKPWHKIVALFFAIFFLFIGVLSYIFKNPYLETSSFLLRREVLEQVPLGSSKRRVMEYIKRKKLDLVGFHSGKFPDNPNYVADIMVFTQKGTVQSNAFHWIPTENNYTEVNLGLYMNPKEFRFWKKPLPLRVSLYFLFRDQELVQIRVIKKSRPF